MVRSAQGAWTLNASPDGRIVYYEDLVGRRPAGLRIRSRHAEIEAQLTNTPGDKFDTLSSPDGKWLAVTAATGDGTVQLFRMPAAGGPMQQLTTGHERMRHPSFSPDGKWIYVQPSHGNIYRVRAEGGPLEPVTRFPEGGLFLEEPTLSPDGRYLYYCRGNGGSAMWLMTLEDPERNVDDAARRHAAGPLRDPVAARRGRDGRGLPGAGHAARARGRGQGHPRAPLRGGRRAGRASSARPGPWPRSRTRTSWRSTTSAGRGRLVCRDGAARGRDARASGCRPRRSRRQGGRVRAADRARAWPPRTTAASSTAT